jgi:hypothetical protein
MTLKLTEKTPNPQSVRRGKHYADEALVIDDLLNFLAVLSDALRMKLPKLHT